MDYELIEKTIFKKNQNKKKEISRKSKSKCSMWTKKQLARNEKLIQTKN